MTADTASLPRPAFNRRLLLILVIGAVALALGFKGVRDAQAASQQSTASLSVLYHALQLFVLSGGPYDSVGPSLHIARFLCPLVTSTALIGIVRAGGRWWRPLVRKTLGQHVIIVGPGEVADAMAKKSERAGLRTVMVASAEQPDVISSESGEQFATMVGDLSSVTFLMGCGADRASHILAVSDSDGDNLAVAAALSKIESKAESQVRVARVQSGATLLSLQQDKGITKGTRVVGLDLSERRARDFLAKHRLDHHPGAPATLVLMGCSPMAKSLAMQAARVAHYAHEKATRLIWVSANGKADLAEFHARYPAIEEILDVTHLAGRTGDRHLRRDLLQLVMAAESAATPILFAVVAEAQGSDRLGAALWIERLCTPADESEGLQQITRIVADLTDQPAMKAIVEHSDFVQNHPRIRPYFCDALENSLELDATDPMDRLAKELHNIYLQTRDREERAGGHHEPRDAEREWAKLDETYRMSNRALADHLSVKLASVGLELVPAEKGQPALPGLSNAQVESLAKLEHRRWMAERRLQGWTPSKTRDNRQQHHDMMVPWEDLLPMDQALDRAFVDPSDRLLKAALANAGLGVREAD